MAKKKSKVPAAIPNPVAPLKAVMKGSDEIYALRAVVRILSNGKGKNGYFFEMFEAVFASEIGIKLSWPRTYLDHENLKIIIRLPDPKDESQKETIRNRHLLDYTLGADDLKTRAALVALNGFDDDAKKELIAKEREWMSATDQDKEKN